VWENIDIKGLRSSVAEVVNHYANFADLVVIGQTDHSAKDKVVEADLPERVVLGGGKPVLIVPYTGDFSSVGERVLVAWKSGRESSRALADAIPLLTRADAVNVFEVNPTDGEKDDMERLCAHLERHGVPARIETSIVSELAVGDVILNRLSDEGSDLLVMGACAQSHFGVAVIGEVARHVLRHMTAPVFMSH
jgi:nucleotide-binding universal stress UspA family protein